MYIALIVKFSNPLYCQSPTHCCCARTLRTWCWCNFSQESSLIEIKLQIPIQIQILHLCCRYKWCQQDSIQVENWRHGLDLYSLLLLQSFLTYVPTNTYVNINTNTNTITETNKKWKIGHTAWIYSLMLQSCLTCVPPDYTNTNTNTNTIQIQGGTLETPTGIIPPPYCLTSQHQFD